MLKMCRLHSDIAVLSLLFPSFSYQGVRIAYYSNQPQSFFSYKYIIDLKVIVLYFYNSTLQFIITTPWLFKKCYEMDTVITVYVGLRENFVQWECTCHARQRFTLPWKQNMFFVHDNHYTRFTLPRFAVGIRIPIFWQPCVKV